MTATEVPARTRRALPTVVALATAFSSANLYYQQPLLPMLSDATGTSESLLGLVTTLGQIGFIVGVVLVLPLGDVLQRRWLIPSLMGLAAIGQATAALAGSIPLLMATAVPIGVGAAASQLLVPYSGDLADPRRRAQAVGRTLGALLSGILLARFAAGLVADAWGWRAVYFISATVLASLAVALWQVAPAETRPARQLDYPKLLATTMTLARSEPWLRRCVVFGALTFGAFNLFWTAVPFRLSEDPFDWSAGMIGALSLVGIGGIVVANLAGAQVQRGRGRHLAGLGIVLVTVSFGLAVPETRSVVLLVLIAVLLDLGVQAVHAVNQCTLVERAGEQRSGANAVYMSAYFLGGAVGSAVAPALFAAFSWSGVAGTGLMLGVLAAVSWLFLMRRGVLR